MKIVEYTRGPKLKILRKWSVYKRYIPRRFVYNTNCSIQCTVMLTREIDSKTRFVLLCYNINTLNTPV